MATDIDHAAATMPCLEFFRGLDLAPMRGGFLFAFGFASTLFVAPKAYAGARIPTHIACVGDSITAGAGDETDNNATPLGPYPKQLGQLLSGVTPPTKVENFGHAGATLLSMGDLPYIQQSEYSAATQFVDTAGAGAIVDVVIMLGTNDSKPQNWNGGANSATFSANYDALVDHFANLSSKPVIYLMLPPAATNNNSYSINGDIIHNDIAPLVQAVATKKGAGVIDLYTPTVGMHQLYRDGVHPTDAGYTLIAKTIQNALLGGVTVPPPIPQATAGASSGGAASSAAGSPSAGSPSGGSPSGGSASGGSASGGSASGGSASGGSASGGSASGGSANAGSSSGGNSNAGSSSTQPDGVGSSGTVGGGQSAAFDSNGNASGGCSLSSSRAKPGMGEALLGLLLVALTLFRRRAPRDHAARP